MQRLALRKWPSFFRSQYQAAGSPDRPLLKQDRLDLLSGIWIQIPSEPRHRISQDGRKPVLAACTCGTHMRARHAKQENQKNHQRPLCGPWLVSIGPLRQGLPHFIVAYRISGRLRKIGGPQFGAIQQGRRRPPLRRKHHKIYGQGKQ
jgi:hypothetical protein